MHPRSTPHSSSAAITACRLRARLRPRSGAAHERAIGAIMPRHLGDEEAPVVFGTIGHHYYDDDSRHLVKERDAVLVERHEYTLGS
jgi:hypothetical protein